jgi:hypothetical protein
VLAASRRDPGLHCATTSPTRSAARCCLIRSRPQAAGWSTLLDTYQASRWSRGVASGPGGLVPADMKGQSRTAAEGPSADADRGIALR